MENRIRHRRLRYHSKVDQPGIASQVFSKCIETSIITQCYIGELVPIVEQNDNSSEAPCRGVLDVFLTSENSELNKEEPYYLNIENETKISITTTVPDSSFIRFNIQIEVHNYPGVIREILSIFRYEAYSSTSYSLNLLINIPLFSPRKQANTSIINIECSLPKLNTADRSNIEDQIERELFDKLSCLSFVRRLYVHSLNNNNKSALEHRSNISYHKQKHNTPIRIYKITYNGAGTPGTAMLISEALSNENLNIRRAYLVDENFIDKGSSQGIITIEEEIEADIQRYPWYQPDIACNTIKKQISLVLSNHQRRGIIKPINLEVRSVPLSQEVTSISDSDIQYNNPNIEVKVVHTENDAFKQYEEPNSNTPENILTPITMSCQIEATHSDKFLLQLSMMLSSKDNPTNSSFNIDHISFFPLYIYGKNTTFTEIIFSTKEHYAIKHASNDARQLQSWFIQQFTKKSNYYDYHLQSIKWATCRSLSPFLGDVVFVEFNGENSEYN